MASSARIHVKPSPGAMPGVLADRGDLALVAVERTRMSMVVSNPRLPGAPIVLANQAFLDLTGYTAEEVIGRNCRFLQGPDTSRHAVDRIRQDLENERDTLVELLNYRKDGSTFWNMLHISPVRDEGGNILYHFASQQDVTRRREAQSLKEAEHGLLREIDHRARNALALVQGIVRLSRSDDPKVYARSVQGRVDALAVAHGLLADGRWRALPIDHLTTALVRSLDLSRVTSDGPSVSIGADQVQPLALLLHELLDNARRHGALSVADGTLRIEWSALPPTITVRLREAGGPPPIENPATGFGLTMVKSVTARQLRGKVDLDWQPSGLISTLEIPYDTAML